MIHIRLIDPLENFKRVLKEISGFDKVYTEDRDTELTVDYHPIYLLIKKALKYKSENSVFEGCSIANKASTCDDAFANYLIFKSKDKQEAESYN